MERADRSSGIRGFSLSLISCVKVGDQLTSSAKETFFDL